MRRHSCWALRFLRQAGVAAILTVVGLASVTALAADDGRVPRVSPASARPAVNPAGRSASNTALARRLQLLPLSFEQNRGQADARVKFLSRGLGYTMFVTGQETVLSLQAGPRTHSLRLRWLGSDPAVEISGQEPLPLKSNYFLGSDPSKWRTNITNYGRLTYRSLYQGVDLVYYGQQGRLENDLVLAPGADPSKIELKIDGALAMSIDPDGNLVLATPNGKVRLLKPHTYQEIKGKRQEVAAAYRLASNGRVRFDVARYDRSRQLVIDPAIDYLTYVSTATGTLSVADMAEDSTNAPCSSTAPCTYIAGTTASASLPNVTAGAAGNASVTLKDAFVLKLDNNGAASFVVYLGGSGDDLANGVAVGTSGNIYVAGQTKSNNFPITSQTYQSSPAGASCPGHVCANNTAFVTKISNDGSQLKYSTYLGGSGDDIANAIAVSSPQAYITGSTTSSSGSGGTAFPTNNGAFTALSKAGNTDGFVAVITANNESIPGTAANCGTFSATCAPATCHSNVATLNLASATQYKAGDWVTVAGIGVSLFNVTSQVLSASGSQITYTVSGCSGGSNNQFSTGPGTITGSMVYGSYFGANSGATGNTVGNAIAIDNSGFADIAGSNTGNFNTTGGVLQTSSGGGTDAIVTQFDPTGSGASSQSFATYLGGAGADIGTAIVTDSSGNIYVAGNTTSTEETSKLCPAGGCSPQAANGNTVTPGTPSTTSDGFIAKLNSTGTTRAWATYLGGAGNDIINRIAWNGTNLFVAGTTASTGFLGSTVLGALSGTQDGFVASVNPTTPAINFGLYVGGSGNADTLTAIALDPVTTTAFYVAGNTDSSNLPVTASAYQVTPAQTLTSGTAAAGFAAHFNVVTANTVALAASSGAATVNNASSAPGLASPNLIWYDSAAGCSTGATTCSDVTIPFTVTNNDATNAATDVVVNITVNTIGGAPPVNIVSSTPNPANAGVSCAAPVNTATFSGVTCKISSLAATVAQQFDIRTLATSSAATHVGSSVTLSAGGTVANGALSSASSTALTIVPVAKLSLGTTLIKPDKSSTSPYSDSVFRVDYDSTLEWDFPVTNNGPGTAADARLSVTLPTGTNMATVVDAGTNTCPNLQKPGGTVVTCDLASLASTGTATVKLKASAPALAGATATLSGSAAVATIAGAYADDGTTNTSTFNSTQRREAVVTVTVTPTPQTGVTQGSAINGATGYQVQVSNAGPSNATAVHLGFTLDTVSTAPVVAGQLTGIRVTGAGSGYTSAPNLTISGGGATTNATAKATISAQVSNTVTIDTPGTGYTNPVVTISGGGGSGATATATQAGGAINGITVTSQGSGYAFPPTVTITDGGYGAAATAQIAAGAVSGFTMLNGGSGYITPAVTIVGGGGTGATATASVTAGVITAINLGVGGSGYTSAPNVIITETGGGPGAGATATATLVNGTVIAATLTSGGAGYTGGPTITPSSGAATFAAGGNFAGANFTSLVSSDTTNCSAATQGFTCNVTDPLLAGGASYTMSVTANAPASIHPAASTQTFSDANGATTAMVSSTTTLGSGGLALAGSGVFSTTVERDADLALASFYDNSPVNLSGTLAYTTAVANNGADAAEGVKVTYTFPVGSTLQNSTPAAAGYVTDDFGAGQCVISTNTYVCTVGHLEKTTGVVGVGTRVFHVQVVPNSAWVNCGTSTCNINVTAGVSGNVVDTTSANDSQTITSTIARKADLSVVLATVPDNSPASLAGPLKLYATVQDNGPDDATATNGVNLTFTVPSGYTYNSAFAGSFSGNSGTTGLTGTACSQVTTTITCVLAGGLTVAQGATTYGIAITPPANAVGAGAATANLAPTVAISGLVTDVNAANNGPVAYASTIQRTADLSLSSAVDNSPISLVGPLKLYATVQDLGPDNATATGGVTVTYTLPATGYTINSSATFKAGAVAYPGGACLPTNGSSTTITCTLASGVTVASGAVTYGLALNPQAALVGAGVDHVTIAPTVAIAGSHIVEATATSDGAYTQPATGPDGPLTYTSTVQRTSNLQVTTVASNTPAAIAGPLKLYATVSNFGPDDATATGGVTLTFNLPAGYGYNSAFGGTFAAGATGLTGAACTQATTSSPVICNFSGGLPVAAGALTYGIAITPPTNAVGAGVAFVTLAGTSAAITGSNIVNDTATGTDGTYNTAGTGASKSYTGVKVQRSADLSATLPSPSDNSPIAISGTLQLYANVANAGPDDATATGGVSIVYTVPTGYTLNTSFAGPFANGAVAYPGGACSQTNATTITCTLTGGITVASGVVKYGLPVTPPATAVATTANNAVIAPVVTITGVLVTDVTKGTDDSYSVAATANNSGTYSSTIQRQSDLQFVITGSGATSPVALNDSFNPLSITTNYKNFGPDNAVGVQVQYTLPSTTGNAYTIKSPATGCAKVANVITCTIGSGGTAGQLANGASGQLVLQLLPDPALVSNNADQASITMYPEMVSADVIDAGQSADCSTSPSDNCGSNTSTLQRRSNLSIVLSNTTSTLTGPFTLHAVVTNNGTDDVPQSTLLGSDLATCAGVTCNNVAGAIAGSPVGAAVIVYTLPSAAYTLSGNTYPTGSVCQQSGATITCQNVPAIANGAAPTFDISITPDPAAITSGNSATANFSAVVKTAVAFDGTSANDTSAATVTIDRKADLQVTSETNNGPVNSKLNVSTVQFTTVYKNAATSGFGDDAPGVLVTYTLPDNTYRWNGDSYGAGVCTQPPQGNANDNVITCNVGLLKVSDGPQTKTLTVLVTDPAAVPTNANSASKNYSVSITSTSVFDDGSSPSAGSPGANNTKADTFIVRRVADLQAAMIDNSPIRQGVPLTFTTSLTDAGPDDAINLQAVYTLPNGNYALSTNSYGTGNCTQSGNVITCKVASLTVAQGLQTYTLSVTPDPAAVGASVASVTLPMGVQVSSSAAYDDGASGAAGANNSATVNSTIQRQSDLVNVSLADNSPVGSAGPLTFTSQIQNVGPNDAVGVIVTYNLPSAGYTFVSSDYGTNACLQAGAVITCQVGTLTASAGKTNTLSVTPDPNAVSTSSNSGTAVTTTIVSSPDVVDDGAAGAPGPNNSRQITSTVERLVHIVVTNHLSSPAPGTFAPLGSTVEYEVDVQNAATTVSGAVTTSALGVTLDESLPATFQSPTLDTVKSDSGWSCDFTTHPNCSYSGSIAPGATKKLFISGSYVDDGSTIALAGGGGYSPGTGSGGSVTATPGTTLSTNVDPLTPVVTHTDIERLVGLSATAAGNPAGGTQTYANLGTPVTYTIVVSNASTTLNASNVAVPTNTATGVYVNLNLPSNFTGVAIDPSSSPGWTCNPATFNPSPVTCNQANPISHPGSATLVLTGTYADDPALTSIAGGRANVQVTAGPGSTLSFQTIAPSVAATNTDIQRLVHLTATHTSTPAAGSFANLGDPVTYTVIVSNAATVNAVATNTATGVTVRETLPANFTNPSVTSNNWTCNFTATPAVCTYAKAIGSGTAALDALTIVGSFDDSVTSTVLPGGGSYQPGTGNVTASAAVAASTSYDPSPASFATSTDIKRNVQLTVAQLAPSVDPVALGATLSYTLQAANAAGSNTAAGVTITDTFPSGFIFSSAAGTNWSCGTPANGALVCTTPSVAPGGSSNQLVITGSYDTTIALPGSGKGTRSNTGTVGSTLSFNTTTGAGLTATATSNIQRQSDLAVSMTASPSPIGAGGSSSNLITYKITISDPGTNDVSGSNNAVNVDFSVPLQQYFKNITAAISAAAGVTASCDTTSTAGHVLCTYSKQTTTTPTLITIQGQFDQAAVGATGSATAAGSVSVTTADALDSTSANNTANSSVVVVDTPVGSAITPLLNSSGNPITVTYPTVTTAGITTQAVSVAPPIGFHEPAIDYPTVDYSAAVPQYFIIASDASAPVSYTTPVSVCVAYTALTGVSFTKPERVRIFDATGRDITASLNATTVCGSTNNPGPNLGAFTVREPRNHAPVAKAASQQLFSGKIGTNQFTLDASGTTDADMHQICNGSPTPPSAGSKYCGDTLTYTWKGPPGMNATNGSDTYTQVVPANADGTLGAPAQVTGSFPLGISTITLTVTDQTGASSTSQVSVTVNSFTLSTTNQNAVISPGQSTSFQVVPQDANKQPLQFSGLMTLTCSGVRNSDNSNLPANHITCTVTPNQIAQGQFSTALIVTVGPNFSQAHPQRPSSTGGGTLAMIFALMSPALMGIVVLPGRSRRWKVLLILALLLACLGVQLGCGGSGSTPPAQNVTAATPAGTYTITITGTAAGGVTSTNTFTLTVQ